MQVLKFNLDANGMGSVTLDGQPVECRSISFRQIPGELADVTIGVFAKVDGEVMLNELTSKGARPWQNYPPSAKEGMLTLEFDTSAAEVALDRVKQKIEAILAVAEAARSAGIDLSGVCSADGLLTEKLNAELAAGHKLKL